MPVWPASNPARNSTYTPALGPAVAFSERSASATATIFWEGTATDIVLAGLGAAAASQRLEGGAGDDHIPATATAEAFDSGPAEAANTLLGGTGNDELTAFAEGRAASDDFVFNVASNTLEGGVGDDSLSATAIAPVTFDGDSMATNTPVGRRRQR